MHVFVEENHLVTNWKWFSSSLLEDVSWHVTWTRMYDVFLYIHIHTHIYIYIYIYNCINTYSINYQQKYTCTMLYNVLTLNLNAV